MEVTCPPVYLFFKLFFLCEQELISSDVNTHRHTLSTLSGIWFHSVRLWKPETGPSPAQHPLYLHSCAWLMGPVAVRQQEKAGGTDRQEARCGLCVILPGGSHTHRHTPEKLQSTWMYLRSQLLH